MPANFIWCGKSVSCLAWFGSTACCCPRFGECIFLVGMPLRSVPCLLLCLMCKLFHVSCLAKFCHVHIIRIKSCWTSYHWLLHNPYSPQTGNGLLHCLSCLSCGTSVRLRSLCFCICKNMHFFPHGQLLRRYHVIYGVWEHADDRCSMIHIWPQICSTVQHIQTKCISSQAVTNFCS